MNWNVIKHLVIKDWALNKTPILLYFLVVFIALVLVGVENYVAFYAGVVILISMMIVICAHMIFTTVVGERKEKTLPFIMSLPVSPSEYTLAKMLSNLSVFAVSWLVITIGTLMVIQLNENIPNGLIPFSVIALLELFAASVLVLAIAILTESEAATIVVTTICNICVSIFWFLLTSIQAIQSTMESKTASWNNTSISIVAIELLFIGLFIAITFYFQNRKKEFL